MKASAEDEAVAEEFLQRLLFSAGAVTDQDRRLLRAFMQEQQRRVLTRFYKRLRSPQGGGADCNSGLTMQGWNACRREVQRIIKRMIDG